MNVGCMSIVGSHRATVLRFSVLASPTVAPCVEVSVLYSDHKPRASIWMRRRRIWDASKSNLALESDFPQ